MFSLVRILAGASLMVMATALNAEVERGISMSNMSFNACSFIPQSNLCETTPGCEWNRRRDRCESRIDDGNGPGHHHRRCSDIYNPWRCNDNPECHWDRRHDRCEYGGGGGGGGHGERDRCEDIYNRYRCEDTRGCDWNYRRDRCERRW